MTEADKKNLAQLARERIEKKKKEETEKKAKKETDKKSGQKKTTQKRTTAATKNLEKKIDFIVDLLSRKDINGTLDLLTGTEKESGVKSIRFLGYVASELKIPGYSKMSRETLFLKIGIKLIELSNLVKDPTDILKIKKDNI